VVYAAYDALLPDFPALQRNFLDLPGAFDREEYVYIDADYAGPNGNAIIVALTGRVFEPVSRSRRGGTRATGELAVMRHVRQRKKLILGLSVIAALGLGAVIEISGQFSPAGAANARIQIWHGTEQKVGHLGNAQDDFNLIGHVEEPHRLLSLQYALNDSIPVELNFRSYRRLASHGHFNADIPIAALAPGPNTIEIKARFVDGSVGRQVVSLTRLSGSSALPLHIDWSEIADPQDVGQYVDGNWRLGEHGLRPAHVGYDRLFLLGNRTWQDYQITAFVTVHDVAPDTGPLSGDNGLGVVMRFAGHVVGGPRNFPVAQPKWGYQPFGAIAWLRWQRGEPDGPAVRQFKYGDTKEKTDYGTIQVRREETYLLKALCQTLPDDVEGRGVTRYAFKLWHAATPEPSSWDWEHVQVSEHALRRGGVALVAHHVDASFGDISIVPLPAGPPES
jgi:hypothetical protein